MEVDGRGEGIRSKSIKEERAVVVERFALIASLCRGVRFDALGVSFFRRKVEMATGKARAMSLHC